MMIGNYEILNWKHDICRSIKWGSDDVWYRDIISYDRPHIMSDYISVEYNAFHNQYHIDYTLGIFQTYENKIGMFSFYFDVDEAKYAVDLFLNRIRKLEILR